MELNKRLMAATAFAPVNPLARAAKNSGVSTAARIYMPFLGPHDGEC